MLSVLLKDFTYYRLHVNIWEWRRQPLHSQCILLYRKSFFFLFVFFFFPTVFTAIRLSSLSIITDHWIFVFQGYPVRKKDRVVQKVGLLQCPVLVTNKLLSRFSFGTELKLISLSWIKLNKSEFLTTLCLPLKFLHLFFN